MKFFDWVACLRGLPTPAEAGASRRREPLRRRQARGRQIKRPQRLWQLDNEAMGLPENRPLTDSPENLSSLGVLCASNERRSRGEWAVRTGQSHNSRMEKE